MTLSNGRTASVGNPTCGLATSLLRQDLTICPRRRDPGGASGSSGSTRPNHMEGYQAVPKQVQRQGQAKHQGCLRGGQGGALPLTPSQRGGMASCPPLSSNQVAHHTVMHTSGLETGLLGGPGQDSNPWLFLNDSYHMVKGWEGAKPTVTNRKGCMS
jgi:hypothetical protein